MAGGTTIRELLVKLGVDGADSDKQLDRIDKGIDAVKAGALVAVGAVATFTGALWGLATSAANAADAALAGAQRTGLAVDTYQALSYAATQSNLEVSELEQALAKQANSAAAVASGNKTATDAYKALGISAKDLEGLASDQVFGLVAESISGMTNETDKLKAAQDIYGNQLAGKLLPLLNEGYDGIEDLKNQARELGLVIGVDDAVAAAEFNDKLDTLWQILTSVRNEVGLKLLPIAERIVTRIQAWTAANRGLIDTKIEVWTDRISRGFEMAADAAELVDAVVQKTFGGWGPVLGAAAAAAGIVLSAIVYLKVSSAWAAIVGAIEAIGVATGLSFGYVIVVVAAVVAAIVLLGLVVQDLWTYFQGGDSVFGRLLERFPLLRSYLEGIADVGRAVSDTFRTWFGLLGKLGALWYEVFSVTSLPALKALGALLLWLGGVALAGIGWWINNMVVPGLTLMGNIFDWLAGKAQALLPYVQAVTGAMNALLGGASQLLGIDLTTGGGDAGLATAGGPSLAGGTSAFAPSPAEFGVGAVGSASTSTTVNQEGNEYNINGVGWTEEKILALIDKAEQTKSQQTSAALEGVEA